MRSYGRTLRQPHRNSASGTLACFAQIRTDMLGQAGASKFAVARRRESARLADMSICGIDEAGRGPWAGPVVAAAVILPRRGRPKGLADSKILTPEAREALAIEIRACAIVAVGAASVDEIDTLNILHASHLAMRRAFDGLSPAPVAALVDGHIGPDLPCPVEFIVDGDAIAPVISAASIIAKVERDRMMTELCALYPGYGFSKHKGYGTPEHREALLRLGPCLIHRRSFKRVREALASPREASASEFDEAAPPSP